MDDNSIVRLYWERDQKAIPATDEKYGKYCTAIARNILGNKEDTEECVNDTYLSAWNSIPPHKPNVLSAFLGKITRNLAFNRYKRNNAGKRGNGELTAVLDELTECVSGADDVEHEADRQELIKDINGFLSTLPSGKRSVFVCRYWYTDSVSDIAARYGMKPNAVSMMLNRLRVQLYNYLSERGYKL